MARCHRGVGTELVRRLLERLHGFYRVDVMCDDDVLPFYARLGFFPTRGAIIRNYTWRETPTT